MKVVINTCYGGFGLSKKAMEMYAEKVGFTLGEYNESYNFFEGMSDHDIPRDDVALVEVVEMLGEEAAGSYSELKVVEIPDGVNWYIEEYDGREWVAERHRTWH